MDPEGTIKVKLPLTTGSVPGVHRGQRHSFVALGCGRREVETTLYCEDEEGQAVQGVGAQRAPRLHVPRRQS